MRAYICIIPMCMYFTCVPIGVHAHMYVHAHSTYVSTRAPGTRARPHTCPRTPPPAPPRPGPAAALRFRLAAAARSGAAGLICILPARQPMGGEGRGCARRGSAALGGVRCPPVSRRPPPCWGSRCPVPCAERAGERGVGEFSSPRVVSKLTSEIF